MVWEEGHDQGYGQGVGIAKHAHRSDEVGGATVETEAFRNDPRDDVGDRDLDEEDDGDHGKFDELIGVELRRRAW